MNTKPAEQKPEPTEQQLEHDAARLHREIEILDGRIKELNAQRSEKKKEIRGITSKIVTIKLRTAIVP
jgi:peptidoglycan hydrolase CwlO-like protein